jgi:DnaJ-class molecular chaperone
VVRGASKQAIKKAYLEKAKQHHPDQNEGDSTKEFLEVQEAYESLQSIVTVKTYGTSSSSSSTSTSTTYEDDRPRTR